MTAAFNALSLATWPLNWLLNRLCPAPSAASIQALEAMIARRDREKVEEALRRCAPAAN